MQVTEGEERVAVIGRVDGCDAVAGEDDLDRVGQAGQRERLRVNWLAACR